MAYTGSKILRRIQMNRHRRERRKEIKALSPEQTFEREQRLLWHKLHKVFYHKEYIVYEDLPEELKSQVPHFEEFIFP